MHLSSVYLGIGRALPAARVSIGAGNVCVSIDFVLEGVLNYLKQ